MLSDGTDQLLLAVVATLLVILVVVGFVRRKQSATSTSSVAASEGDAIDDGPSRPIRQPPAAPQVRRIGGSRVVRSRLRARATDQPTSQDAQPFHDADFEDSGDESLNDEPPASSSAEGKIGVKKRKKLEMKAEKKASREQELLEREESKKRRELLEDERRKDEELARQDEAKQLELERLRKEEEERREREEYAKMKESFAIESEGFDHDIDEDDVEDLLKQFVKCVEDEKVVYLEDLASRFRLKTQEVIDRLNALMNSGDLTGVIDDRGKFIYISPSELESVAKFIKQRGRVTVTELAECSNQLINMNSGTKSV